MSDALATAPAPGPVRVGRTRPVKNGPDGKPLPKKDRKKKIDYPLTEGQKISKVPEDFNPKEHKPLKRTVWASHADYQEYLATIYDRRAARFTERARRLRTEAVTSRQYGDESVRKAAVKATKIASQLNDIRATLAAAGIDFDALMRASNTSTAGANAAVAAGTTANAE